MIPYQEMQQMLSELLDELPEVFFEQLNGGVTLLKEVRSDPAAAQLYILGEYIEGPLVGCEIALYYGSFAALFGDLGKNELRRELRATLRHEFRHHLESLSGVDDLDREDEEQLLEYQREDAARQDPESAKQAAFTRGLLEGKRQSARQGGKQERRGFWSLFKKS